MRAHDEPPSGGRRPVRGRIALLVGLAAMCALTLSGCGAELKRGYLPKGVTSQSQTMTSFWNASWIAALAVGVIVWGLILWCVVRYRRRPTDTGLPVQLRYNVPIEILYTVLPVFMVAVLFLFTVKDDKVMLETSAKPDVTVNVVGKQWSWDFNYTDANTYEAGTQAEVTGKPGVENTLPTLWLPVNSNVKFVLTARDVIHSFWVPQFLMKMDVIPGKVNTFPVHTDQVGTFQGRCAELCGAYHSAMLFRVKVVPLVDFNAHMRQLRAQGNVGQLSNSLNREGLTSGQQQYLPANDRGR